jgi:spore maturation protein CgeB
MHGTLREADLVIVGSFVPDGAVGDWVQRRPRAAHRLLRHRHARHAGAAGPRRHELPEARQIAGYDLYLSFTGGPTLRAAGARVRLAGRAAALLLGRSGAVFPRAAGAALGPGLHGHLQRRPAAQRGGLAAGARAPMARGPLHRRGPQYPDSIVWPANVRYTAHLPPAQHRAFYNRQRFTLNVTRADMIARAGRRACGCSRRPPAARRSSATAGTASSRCWCQAARSSAGRFAARGARLLRELPEDERRAVGERARQRILAEHTAAHRAAELEAHARMALLRMPVREAA